MTDYVGRNAYPMWVGDTMFFNSDRGADGITNLWAAGPEDGRLVRQVTIHTDFDVMSPSSDGKRIVYVQSGYLWVLDTAGGAPARSRCASRPTTGACRTAGCTPAEYLHFVDVAGDGKAVVVAARGDVFHLAVRTRTRCRAT